MRVVGRVTVDGRDAIELESLDGKSTYYVDASTYDPIEWTTKGTDGGVTLPLPGVTRSYRSTASRCGCSACRTSTRTPG